MTLELSLNFLFLTFGIIIGSFLNVVIHRLPNGISIIFPRSFCPKCKYKIPFYRNIPIISYIFQFGKCANCKKKISFQYPLVEILSGLIWLFGFWSLDRIPEIIYFSLISNILLAIAFIDYKHFIIPIPLTISSVCFILTYLLFCKYYINYNINTHFFAMLIGSGYLSIIFMFTTLIAKRQSLGYGDIQLLMVLGLWIGNIMKILFIIFISALLGLLFWLYLSFIKGYDNKRALPFGTFLSFTAIIFFLIPNWKLDRFIFLIGDYLSLPFK